MSFVISTARTSGAVPAGSPCRTRSHGSTQTPAASSAAPRIAQYAPTCGPVTGSDNGKRRDSNFQGFGRFLTSTSGEYYFRTIKPVAYPGRTPHIHFKIKQGDRELLTTQCYVKGDPGNDRDGIYRSVRKTNRVLVAHEDAVFMGFGAEVVARITENCFDSLDAPVMRVGADDCFVPSAPNLEEAVLPQVADLRQAVEKLLQY